MPDITIRIKKLKRPMLGYCHQTTKRGKDDGKGGQKQAKRMDIYIDDDAQGSGWEQPGDSQKEKDRKWNRERIIKHELRHAIGLDHTHDVARHGKDIMVEGPRQDKANDAPVLTTHDKAEAGTCNTLCALDPVGTRPGYAQTGQATLVAITGGAGTDLLLDQAISVQLEPVFPDQLQMRVLDVNPQQITAQIFAQPNTATDQGYVVHIEYPFGAVQLAGVITVGDDPDIGLMPHSFYGRPLGSSVGGRKDAHRRAARQSCRDDGPRRRIL